MSYYGPSYTVAEPEELDDKDDAEKLKDMRSALSSLKLAINNNYPMFTNITATFGAYLYAVTNKKKKSMDSILKAALKKNYSFNRFPLLTLANNLSTTEMKIIIDDFLNVSNEWNLEYEDTIRLMFEKYPKETAKFIENGRLNKYEKGENRLNTTKLILELGDYSSALIALNTFFGFDYIQQYGIYPNKLEILIDAVNKKDDTFKRKIREKYFYSIAAKVIPAQVLEADFESGMLNDKMISTYMDYMITNQKEYLIRLLSSLKIENLRVKLIGSNTQTIDFISEKHPELFPTLIKDVFLF